MSPHVRKNMIDGLPSNRVHTTLNNLEFQNCKSWVLKVLTFHPAKLAKTGLRLSKSEKNTSSALHNP